MLLNKVNEANIRPIEGVVTRGCACTFRFFAKPAIHSKAVLQDDRPLGGKIDDRADVVSEAGQKIAIGRRAFERLDCLAFPEKVLVLRSSGWCATQSVKASRPPFFRTRKASPSARRDREYEAMPPGSTTTSTLSVSSGVRHG